jgi:hypothetical protein
MAQIIQANGYGGMMVFDVGTTAADMLSAISNVFDGEATIATPNCLQPSTASPDTPAVPEQAPKTTDEPEPPAATSRPHNWLRRLLDWFRGR